MVNQYIRGSRTIWLGKDNVMKQNHSLKKGMVMPKNHTLVAYQGALASSIVRPILLRVNLLLLSSSAT